MKKQRFKLIVEDIGLLEKILKNSESYHERRKAQALLLLNEGKSIKELAEIFKVNRNTIGRGRKELLSQEIQEEIHTLVKEFPNNIKKVHQFIMDKHNISFSRELLRTVIKKIYI